MHDIVLECTGVSHWFGEKKVLYDVNLRVARGQIVGLVGPSGSGKSTLLRAILGTHPPCAGEVLMEGRPYRQPHRDRGIVYQAYSLFPFLTAEANVAFGLMLDQTDMPFRWFKFWKWRRLRREHLREAAELLERLGLGAARHQYPDQLSGGMRQRVAIAQALVMRPKLLLLDEPFGALDEATREDLQLMLLRLYAENAEAKQKQQKPPYTILLVTHELNEALYVCDRVIGLSQYHAEGQNGATIVYDKAAPVFSPTDQKEIGKFLAQKEELLHAVFDEAQARRHSKCVNFWENYDKSGRGWRSPGCG
jgi:NitT/TauT family transport system ATP-binding protein